MNKEAIKEKIKEIQNKIIQDLISQINEMREASDLEEDETKDLEDLSHQEEAGDMVRGMEEQLVQAENDLLFNQKLSTEKSDEVTLGSFVETDRLNFYIGTALTEFEVEGKKIIGLSTKAPIYIVMRGKRKGDSFSYADKTYKIKAIS